MCIDKEFDGFIEFPTDDKTYVTTVSAKLFAEHWAEKELKESRIDYDEYIKRGKEIKILHECICCYAREELGDIDFESDNEALEYFKTFADSRKAN